VKLKVTLGALIWAIVITVIHVQLNVGWSRLWDRIQVMRGVERAELVVGFLPVT